MYDLVVKNARIVDGTGAPGYEGSVAIKGGRIRAVGSADPGASPVFDAKGCVVCPGFIDMHTHMDLAFFQERVPDAKIRQGVTTDLLGQDGLGAAPVAAVDRALLADLLAGLDGIVPPERWTWGTFADYLGALEARPLPCNVAVLASHGPIRIAALGMSERKATPEELGAMRRELARCLDDGAFGLSTGLIYPPCSYCDTEELVELNREVARVGGIFVVHQRDEGYGLGRSFDEVCDVARRSGAHLHVSHLQAYGRMNWPIMDDVLRKADDFVANGHGLSWDRYPYLAGSTVLTAVLPAWTFQDGTEALIASLRKPEFRERIHADFKKGLDVWHNRQISVGWGNIIVSAVTLDKNRWMEGFSCEEIAARLELDPIDMVCDLLAEERLAVTMISFYGSEEVLAKVLAHPCATVGSDGIYGGRPHPRLYGAYPKFLHDYSGLGKLFPLEEAVRKITSYPAKILGLADRGCIAPGCWADLVVFDPETIRDTATYDEPESYPLGIEAVFVNGVRVVDENGFTGRTPGLVLRKGDVR